MSHPSDQFVPKELVLELGRLAFYFQQLEAVVRQAIWRCFLDLPSGKEMARVLINDTPTSKLGGQMLALYLERFGESDARVTEMKKVAKEYDRLVGQRNGFLHSHWLDVNLFGGAATRVRDKRATRAQVKRGHKPLAPPQEVEEVPVSDVRTAANECADLARRLFYDLAPRFGHPAGTE